MNYAEVRNYPVFLIQYSKFQIPNTKLYWGIPIFAQN